MRTRLAFSTAVVATVLVTLFGLSAPAQAAPPTKYWLTNTSSKVLAITKIETLPTQDGSDRWPAKSNNNLPPTNTLIEPGETQEFIMDNVGFGGNNVMVQLQERDQNGKQFGNFTVNLRMNKPGWRYSFLMEQSAGLSVSIDVGGQDVYVYDRALTTVDADVPAYSHEQQGRLLAKLCEKDDARCSFVTTPTSPGTPNPVLTRSAGRPLGKIISNESCGPIPNSIKESFSATLTSSWSMEVSTEYSFSAAFKVGAKAGYAGGVATTTDFSAEQSMSVPVFKVGWWSSTIPVDRYAGVWTVKVNNTTWTINKAFYEVPNTRTETGTAARLTPVLRNMTPQEIAVIEAGRTCD